MCRENVIAEHRYMAAALLITRFITRSMRILVLRGPWDSARAPAHPVAGDIHFAGLRGRLSALGAAAVGLVWDSPWSSASLARVSSRPISPFHSHHRHGLQLYQSLLQTRESSVRVLGAILIEQP